jgi:hypothetical protein
MYRAAEHRADDSAMGKVDRIFTDELGWMFTRNQVREYGIDGHALVVRSDGQVTGRMLATQVKGGPAVPRVSGKFRTWPADVRLPAAVHLGPPLRGLVYQLLLDGVHQRQGTALELADLEEAERQPGAGPE